MAKVWHPDRFARKPHLIKKAQEKMKELNEAYEFLSKNPGAAAGQSTYQYQPRYKNYGAGTAVSTIRFKERRKKRKINWGRIRTAIVIIAVLFALFSDTAAPWRHKARAYLKKITSQGTAPKKTTHASFPAPAPTPAPTPAPVPSQPPASEPPRSDGGRVVSTRGPDDRPPSDGQRPRFRRFGRPPGPGRR